MQPERRATRERRFTPERWHARFAHDSHWYGPWDPEIVANRFKRRSPAWTRVWIPVIISFAVQVPSVFFHVSARERSIAFTTDPLANVLIALLIALIGPIALIGARRFPGPVVAIVGVAASVDLLLANGEDGPPYIAFAFAIGSAIVRGARVWAWVTIAVAWVASIVLAAFFGLEWQPWRIAGITIGILILVGFAEGLRTRREHIDEMVRTIATRRQSEVQAERVRIARELHDVLAHSLSQINVQAGVGLHLMEKQPEQAAAALASIKETSKTALDEVRSVLGVLRAERGADPDAPLVPEPGLSRLGELVASVGAQGVTVELGNHIGEAPQATQLALYRIVQESLTNVVRHANASRVWVDLVENDSSYLVTVADDGAGPSSGTISGTAPGGRGLLGMHERAELLGGTLTAQRRASGGFEVTATIPKKGQHS